MISTEPKEYVIRVLKGDMNLLYQEFWALKNVSLKKKVINWDSWFEWCRKSTLLKLISGVMKPTEGSIRNKGRIILY